MSDSDNQEPMRPIPDGGLKDAMPTWLKRPPAWRSLPTVDERIERTLPEPDTSVIDPTSLVDVSDLPQWLQVIAARGTGPTPDEVVGHAVEVVQSAHAEGAEASEAVDGAEASASAAEPVIPTTIVESSPATGSTRMLWLIIVMLVIAVLVLGALQLR